MQQRRSAPIHRWRNVLIENPNHIRIANSEDDAVQKHRIADSELADIGFGQGRFETILSHETSCVMRDT
jgi:hypothetical protein